MTAPRSLATDCIASLKRWMNRGPMGQVLAARMAEISAVDESTFRFQLKQPYALVLKTLGRPNTPAFICPERVAGVPLNEQITTSTRGYAIDVPSR